MKDRRKKGWRRLFRSFIYAGRGLCYVVKEEQNMQFHFLAAVVMVVLGLLFSIPLLHWMMLILLIGGMFALEIINTAIERVVDFITEDYHPMAKLAKDIAAAGVLIYSIIAVIIGIFIFYRPILALLTG